MDASTATELQFSGLKRLTGQPALDCLDTVPVSGMDGSPAGDSLGMQTTTTRSWPRALAMPLSPWASESPWLAGLKQRNLLSTRTHGCRTGTMSHH